jgi:hypothetical protein
VNPANVTYPFYFEIKIVTFAEEYVHRTEGGQERKRRGRGEEEGRR